MELTSPVVEVVVSTEVVLESVVLESEVVVELLPPLVVVEVVELASDVVESEVVDEVLLSLVVVVVVVVDEEESEVEVEVEVVEEVELEVDVVEVDVEVVEVEEEVEVVDDVVVVVVVLPPPGYDSQSPSHSFLTRTLTTPHNSSDRSIGIPTTTSTISKHTTQHSHLDILSQSMFTCPIPSMHNSGVSHSETTAAWMMACSSGVSQRHCPGPSHVHPSSG